jgi:two-component system, NtrC family, sensor kinase
VKYEEKNQKDSTIKYLKLMSSIKDELNNTEKVRAFQNISFNEELKLKELENARIENQNRLQLFILLGGLLVAIIIAVILLRNNRHKEKINRQLSMQKRWLTNKRIKLNRHLRNLRLLNHS